jgi:AcrR family transcriptional regulator
MVDRDLILSAATRLFHEKGFARATTDEIAAEAGITKRTLYRYIGSKEALLLAIHEKFLGRVLAAVDQTGPPDEQVATLLRNYVRTVVTNLDEIRVFFEERPHLSAASLARVVELRDPYEAVFRDTLRRGMSDGTFRTCDVPVVTEGALGVVANMYEWYRPGGRLSADQVADMIVELVLGGLPGVARMLPPRPASEPVAAPRRAAEYEEQQEWASSPVLSRILDVASEMMYEQGYDNMSTRGLAEAAGLTKSALYYYIPNKETVLFQVNLRLTLAGLSDVERISAQFADPVEALRQIVVTHCETVARNMGALRALSYEMRFLGPEHRDRILELRRAYVRAFALAVRQAVGADPGDARTDIAALAVMGTLNFMHHWYTEGARLSAGKVGETLFELVWAGLRASTG